MKIMTKRSKNELVKVEAKMRERLNKWFCFYYVQSHYLLLCVLLWYNKLNYFSHVTEQSSWYLWFLWVLKHMVNNYIFIINFHKTECLLSRYFIFVISVGLMGPAHSMYTGKGYWMNPGKWGYEKEVKLTWNLHLEIN